jgi:tRNA G10  N-methylase Trm11
MRSLIHKNIKNPFIVDPQVGTGTSAIAAAQLGFTFLGSDIDPKQIKTARHRLATELEEVA